MITAFILFLILFPFIFGTMGFFISKKFPKCREIFAITINLIEMIVIIILGIMYKSLDKTSFEISWILGLGISFKIDTFRFIYATVSIFLWLMTITFSKDYMKKYNSKDRYYFFYLLTLTGVVGVFFSNDLFTTFVFFEIMSIASYPLVIHDEKEKSMNAGETYLGIAIITGMILLMGLFLIYSDVKSLDFETLKSYTLANNISTRMYVGGILALLGFGAKAGMYPLHIWLPKAHPVAPAPASALLSGILTKTGVFGIIVISSNIFFASESFGIVLLVFAVITMFLGALLALFSIDLKRTLACSSMSQIGFILTGLAFMVLLGEEGSLAAEGALLHMINHSLIKLVLFMAAGVVAMNIHKLDLNDIKGFGRKKPFLMIVFLIGALGIMGVPFFNGYVSKTMIHESIVEYIHLNGFTGGKLVIFKSIEWIFLISGGLTVAYMTKLFVNLFIEKNNDEATQQKYDDMTSYLSPLSKGVFIISVIALPVIGILPNALDLPILGKAMTFFNKEALEESISFFGWECLKGGLVSIAIGLVIYFGIVRTLLIKNKTYLNVWPDKLNLEYLVYRPIIINFQLWFIKHIIKPIDESFEPIVVKGTMLLGLYFFRVFAIIFDWLLYLLRISVLRPVSYKFENVSLSYKIGRIIDKIKPHKSNSNYHAEKMDSLSTIEAESIQQHSVSFSFALGMICIGLVIIIIFAIFQ